MDYYHLTLTSKCNHNCLFCLVKGVIKVNLSSKEAFKKLEKAHRQGAKYLSIDGGEPTILPYFKKLVNKAVNLGFKIIAVKTNGTGFSDYNFAREVIKGNEDIIRVYLSLHSSDKKIHDRLTKTEGSFDVAVRAINNITKLNGKLVINLVVCSLNYKHLKGFVEFLAEYKIQETILLFIVPQGNALKNKWLIPKIENTIPYVKKAIDLGNKLGIKVRLTFFPFCLLGKNYMQYAVEYNIPGDIRKFDSLFLKTRYQSPECKKCVFFTKCPGIFKEYYKIRGFHFKPIK